MHIERNFRHADGQNASIGSGSTSSCKARLAKLRNMDLADLRAKRPTLGKTAYIARVKGVMRSQKAQAVAKKYAARFRKTCKQVVERKGAAADN